MDYDVHMRISKIVSAFVTITIATGILAFFLNDITHMEEYNYPLMSFRYFEKQGILSTREEVEVIYETDSEIMKKCYSLSSIKIGEKTEVVVHKAKSGSDFSTVYMTIDDYRRITEWKNKK